MEDLSEELQGKLDAIAQEYDRKVLEDRKINRKILFLSLVCVIIWTIIFTCRYSGL